MADSQTATSAPEFKSAHFIGIGGAGMSGIALVLHERGYAVTGSDLKTSRYIRQLTRAGVKVHVGHEAATIDEVKPDVVVVSTAIPESNPELVRARELGIPVWPRAKMLSALGHGYTTVAVAGTHGKTTTSSMCATMLDRMGLDPSFLIGGIVEGYDTNGKNGSGDYFVAEADESDSSFLFLNPNVVIVTNVEADHLDHYSGIEEIEATFAKFMSLVGEDGTVTAVAAGTATISASAEGADLVTCTVTVKEAPKKNLVLRSIYSSEGAAQTEFAMSVGDPAVPLTVDGTDSTVKWSTENSGVVTVNSAGEVTAVASGKTTVTAEVDGQTLTITVIVW